MDTLRFDPRLESQITGGSEINRIAPGRQGQAPPALGLQRRPELFGFGLPEVPALLQKRWAVGHAAAPVDENPWFVDPSLLVAMKPPDPAVVAVDQPALSHGAVFSTSVLIELRVTVK